MTRRTPSEATTAPDPAPAGEGVDGRTTRWEAHRLARRAELVTATLRAVRRHGAGVGMDDIAAVGGTSKTVFYRHFGDRAGLYRAVAESVDAMLTQRVNDAFAQVVDSRLPRGPELTRSGPAQRALLRAAVDTYLQLVQDDPEVYKFIVAAPLVPAGERGLEDPATMATDVMSGRMAALLADRLMAAGRDADQAATWGRAVVGMVSSVADQWLRSGDSASGTGREELVEDVTDLLWGGLASAWPSN